MNESSCKIFISLIGGLTTHIISGSVLFFLNFNPYRYSYLKRNDPSLQFEALRFILPMSFSLMFAAFWSGAFIEKKTHPRIAVLIGDLFVLLAIGLLYLSTTIILDYFAFAFYGIGIGINFLSSSKCILSIVNRKFSNGLMIGISMFGYFFSAAFCIMVNLMINPENFKRCINYNGEGEYIYPLFITKRLSYFIVIYLAVIAVLCVVNVLCMCSYKNEESRETMNSYLDVQLSGSFKESIIKNNLTYMLLLLELLINFSPFLCLFFYYEYGKQYHALESMMFYCSFGFILMCGVSHLVWGCLYNQINFKLNMYILLGSQFILTIGFYFSVTWKLAYLFIISLFGFTYGGISVIFPVYSWEMYKNNIGMEAYGFIALGKAICALLPPIILYSLSSGNISYQTIFISLTVVGAAGNLLGVLIVIFGTKNTVLSYD